MALALREFLDSEGEGTAPPAKPKALPNVPENPPEEDEGSELEQLSEPEPGQKSADLNPPPAQIPGNRKKAPLPETVKADVYFSMDKLPAGSSAKIIVLLRIEDKWHIRGNPSGSEEIEPTTIELKSKSGVVLSRVRFPPGEKTLGATGEPETNYSRQALVMGQLDVPESAGGKDNLIISINYQACSKTRCNPPATLTLKVPVEIAVKGAPVKPINKALFGKK